MRQRIYAVITDKETSYLPSVIYNWVMVVLIVLSLLPLCFKEEMEGFILMERVLTAIFMVDYLLR